MLGFICGAILGSVVSIVMMCIVFVSKELKHECTQKCEGCDYFRREHIGQKEKLKCMLDYPCKEYSDSISESFQRWYEFGFNRGFLKAKTEVTEGSEG